MASFLCELISKCRSLSIIGMCKNAGKTTVLNHIIQNFAGDGQALALTSIGRDGEAVDVLTGTAKPGIYVYAGSLIATASELLDECDITREILFTTGIYTPLGEVVVIRALSDGYVQLAGPSMISQLEQLSQRFLQSGASRIIIDGAVSRKTLCSRSLTEGTVLCSGASCGVSMDAVVKETLHVCEMLSLPLAEDTAPGELIRKGKNSANKTILFGREQITLPPLLSIEEGLRKYPQNETTGVYIDGALSDYLLQQLLLSGAELSGINFIVRDASKILVSSANYRKLRLKGSGIRVLDDVNLLAVTINPFSAYGNNFNNNRFRESLAEQLKVPVLNVEDI